MAAVVGILNPAIVILFMCIRVLRKYELTGDQEDQADGMFAIEIKNL
jgi:hypothetical protein